MIDPVQIIDSREFSVKKIHGTEVDPNSQSNCSTVVEHCRTEWSVEIIKTGLNLDVLRRLPVQPWQCDIVTMCQMGP